MNNTLFRDSLKNYANRPVGPQSALYQCFNIIEDSSATESEKILARKLLELFNDVQRLEYLIGKIN